MSVFQVYEPHTEYIQAVLLTPENFDEVADDLSRRDGMHVSKNLYWGEPYSLTLILQLDSDGEPAKTVTCRLHEYIVRGNGAFISTMNRHEFRKAWRRVSSDPWQR